MTLAGSAFRCEFTSKMARPLRMPHLMCKAPCSIQSAMPNVSARH